MAEAASRHSGGQKDLDLSDLPTVIRTGVEELRAALPRGSVRCVHWNDDYVAVVVDVEVDLPTRGAVDEIDIRPVEPVLLLLHRRHYPRKAPIAYSDRTDFPSKRLAHLNPTTRANLASFCLHRGSLDDWFAEHSLTEFVGRVRGWLRDAASNRLIREDDCFEGTRINDYAGIAVYPPDELIATVGRAWEESEGRSGWRLLMVTLLQNAPAKEYMGSRLSYEINFALPGRPGGKLLDLFVKFNRVRGDQPGEDKLLLGILAWAARTPIAEYFGGLPTTYGDLRGFCDRLGVDLSAAVADYRAAEAQLLGGVPIVVAILRPQPLIGTTCPVELLHFVVLASPEYRETGGQWRDVAPVWPLSHRTPLTVRFARELSRQPLETSSPFALVGCGAVGSRISLQLARSGHVDQTLVDYAELAPHHLVRHGLPPQAVGQNKAEALAAQIVSMYRLDQSAVRVRTVPGSLNDLLDQPDKLNQVPFLIDATASAAVLGAVADDGALPCGIHYSRCEIGDEGKLGLFFWEGPGRNPRVDDLQAYLFNLGQCSRPISHWLQAHRREHQAERAAALEEIGIGVSCSSTTLRLADDLVTFHASLFVGAYKRRNSWVAERNGKIQISLVGDEQNVTGGIETIDVPPIVVLVASESTQWQVRVQAQVSERMRMWMKKAGRNETGGLLLGFVHKKRKVIYVTDLLPPSRDSKGTPYAFRRGIKDYPIRLDEIAAATGGLIGYVGEWHTHPGSSAKLSEIDMKAVEGIQRHLAFTGLPTHIMVCAGEGIGSFVFASDT